MKTKIDADFDKKVLNISALLNLPSQETEALIYTLSDEPYEYSLDFLERSVKAGRDIRNLL